MPTFNTRFGRKELAYSNLTEYKLALGKRIYEIEFPEAPKETKHDLGDGVVFYTVEEKKEPETCAFGTERNTLKMLAMMIDSYESADCDHSIVDFYNQNQDQYVILGCKAREFLMNCQAKQVEYFDNQETLSEIQKAQLVMEMNDLMTRSTAFNNTALAASLSNKILTEGEKALYSLHDFNDWFTNTLRENFDEVRKLAEEFQ